jgi:23S rRNA G2445 N2-methylase RlmL
MGSVWDAAKLSTVYSKWRHPKRNVRDTVPTFTGNLELSKQIGLRSKKRSSFFNGPLECRLLEYEVYSGSKRSPLK